MFEEIEYPRRRIRGGAGYFLDEKTVIIEGYYGEKVTLSEDSSPNGPIPNGNGIEIWNSFIPLWRVGASGGLYADPGNGYIQGWYKEKPAQLWKDGQLFGEVKEIELFIELKAVHPTIPAGEGFEFEVPENLRPPSTDSARGGGGDLWILGGENSFSISPKWTDRRDRPMRILIIGNGWEWTTNKPKTIPITNEKTLDLYFWSKYFVLG